MTLSRPLHRLAALAAIAVPFALAAPAGAQTAVTTIYVAPTGSDTAAGTSTAPLKTLGTALSRATGGQRIQLAAGSYPLAKDDKARSSSVQVVGAGPTKTQVAGLTLSGGQRLSFSAIKFTGTVAILGHPVKHAAQPATKVSFSASEFTASGACVSIKEGSREIALTGNSIHDCSSGIVGPGNVYVTDGVTIERNTIQRITADAIQFGAWNNVRVADNTIRDIVDPAAVIHNDGIQFTGNSKHVVIASNRILNSRSQLLFIQDAIGPVDDVQVVNNLLVGAGAVALQSLGATHARFVNNTIWNAKDGGLWLRRGSTRNDGTYVVPNDTVMSNNVARTIRLMEGAATSAAAGNVVLCPTPYSGSSMVVPPGAACVADHGFVTDANGDLRLSAESPTRALGSTLALPATDLTGAARIGAVPGAFN